MTLTPIEQRQVDFYGQSVTAVLADDRQIYVSLAEMCDILGVDRRSQRRRIRNNELLEEGYKLVPMETAGGVQEVAAVDLDTVPLWLSGIQTSAVREEIRPDLVNFIRNVKRLVAEAFKSGELNLDNDFEALLQTDSPAVQAYKMLKAQMQLARQQIILESRMATVENRLDQIEAKLGDPDRKIDDAQAQRISDAVKALAMALSEKYGGNRFGQVYGEMYRRYSIPGYRELPAAKFDGCMAWLREWYGQVSDDSLPF